MAGLDAAPAAQGRNATAAGSGGAEPSDSPRRNRTTAPTIDKRIAVLLINFTRQASQPWTKELVRDIYFGATHSVASYYAELSDGQVAISGNVFGYLTLNVGRDWCNYKGWAAAARTAASSSGVDLNAYTNVVYAFPWQQVCWWSGFAKGGSADLPGRDSWINGLMSLYIASHELGHNLGANHAGAITCTQDGLRVAYSATCSTYAYGDPFDIMGYTGQRHMQAWYRWRLGFLADTDIETVAADGTYRVFTAELAAAGPRVLRIPRPAGDYYYVELRQPFGAYDDFAPNDPAVAGVSIRIAREVGSPPTKLVDTTPETCTFLDAPLSVGRTFVDGVNNISIKTLSVSPTGADVQIRIQNVQSPPADDGPPADDSSPPGPPGKVSAGLVTAREVAVSWEGAEDDAGVDHYVVTAQGEEVGTTCDLILREITVEDGRTYEFGVYGVDAIGNVGPTRTVSFAVPDVTAPRSPRQLTAAATGVRSITLNWQSATDNAAVSGYLVTRDGAFVAQLSATTTSYTDVSLTTDRTYRYKLTAIDAARNASPPAKVRVTL